MPNVIQRYPLTAVLVFASLIVCVSMGIRHTFGLFLTPITTEHGWSREAFSFAIALQNLAWGASQTLVGMLADRYGARRVLWIGGLCYVVGLIGMAWSSTATGFVATAGLLLGFAQSGTTFSVVYSALGQLVPAEKRSWAMGIVAAAGSLGQFLMVPIAGGLIAGLGWFGTLLVFAAGAALIIPFGTSLTRGLGPAASAAGQSVKEAFREAFSDRGYVLLTLGFFVCGFQVIFIAVHLPTYLADKGMSGNIGVMALALIGLFNVLGTYGAGHLGTFLRKRSLLATVYISRSVAISLFMLAPLSHVSVYLFAATMGILWLATIPLTNAIIAQIFGVRYLGMLTGVVFFSHQIGAFLGVWLGGLLFDTTGSYTIVWSLCIALGVIAALLNLGVDESSLASRRAQPAAA